MGVWGLSVPQDGFLPSTDPSPTRSRCRWSTWGLLSGVDHPVPIVLRHLYPLTPHPRPSPSRALSGDAAGSASGRERAVGRTLGFQSYQRAGPPPGLLGRGDRAQALGRFSSPDASPGSESPAPSRRTLGHPQIQLGLPRHALGAGLFQRSGSLYRLPFRVLESECAPCRHEPTADNLAHAVWAWGILAGYLSG